MTPLLSLRDSAKILGISFWTVRRFIQQGTLTPVRIGRRVLLEQSTIEQFIDQCRRP
jgi:excisionase family DNA binding protein